MSDLLREFSNGMTLLNQEKPWFIPTLVFIYGACVGSFLNVCIYRIPAGRSVVTPRSACACGKPLPWYDNLPILSWLLLRGKARCCGRPFSFRYPAVEALTAGLFLAAWMMFPPVQALCLMAFAFLLLGALFTDLDHQLIPDRYSVGGFILGVFLAFFFPALHGFNPDFPQDHFRSGLQALIGGLVGSAVIVWIMILGTLALKKDAMGFGDAKLMGCIGAFIGWQGALFSIFGGAAIGCVAVAILAIVRKFAPGPLHSVPRDETDGATLYLEIVTEKPAGETTPLSVSIPTDQPFWKPETMAVAVLSTTTSAASESPGRETVTTRIRAQTIEGEDANRRVPFGPMLAAGAFLYVYGLHRYADRWLAETARLLFDR